MCVSIIVFRGFEDLGLRNSGLVGKLLKLLGYHSNFDFASLDFRERVVRLWMSGVHGGLGV